MPTDNEHRTLIRRSCELHYWCSGRRSGPLVVLTHGAALDHTAFDTQVGPLADAGFFVVTWDLRGHGLSKPIGERFSAPVAADDLLAILDDLGRESAHLVGHSFGGYVVQHATFRHPDRVAAVVIIGCTPLADRPSMPMRVARRVLPLLLPLFSVDTFQRRTVRDLSSRDDIKDWARETARGLSKQEYLQIINAGLDCLAADAGFGPNYQIPVPFLLIHGADDRANGGIAPKQANRWAAREPNCTRCAVPDAGHTANQDNPEAFNTQLLEFLVRHASQP